VASFCVKCGAPSYCLLFLCFFAFVVGGPEFMNHPVAELCFAWREGDA
jgi:hypothetical protein